MQKTVLITGASGGLGISVTDCFLNTGWNVVGTVLRKADQAALQENAKLKLIVADLFQEKEVREAVANADSPQAPLTAVVNLVGGFFFGKRVHETAIETLEDQFRLNMRPTYLVTAAALPILQTNGGGSVICVSSRTAEQPTAGSAAYSIAKAAVLAFVDATSVEYLTDNIRVNAILPSLIDTEANRLAMPDANHKRWVNPEHIAKTILFLCSNEASSISGAHLPIYGRA